MKLRGIEFGNILGGSGVQGFLGEGYWYHKFYRPFGLNFEGMTFVSKTATLLSRKGNMPLTRNYTPRNLFPGCIKMKPKSGAILNSVGLSNPGLSTLLGTGEWQKRTNPFWISIMSVADTRKKRLEETRIAVETIGLVKDEFAAPFGLQMNLSCPNQKHDPAKLIDESIDSINEASVLKVPIMPKFSIASAPIKAVMELDHHPACDAICVSNTIPFGWHGINWKEVWGSNTSPLTKLGGGGLSGSFLRPLVCKYINHLRQAGFTKPINGGGGIMNTQDVHWYHCAGASSVFISSVAILRPWRVKSIIKQANTLNWR